jgi:hypothetical protein
VTPRIEHAWTGVDAAVVKWDDGVVADTAAYAFERCEWSIIREDRGRRIVGDGYPTRDAAVADMLRVLALFGPRQVPFCEVAE